MEDLPGGSPVRDKFNLASHKKKSMEPDSISRIDDSGSMMEKDVDGLLKWAKELPDDPFKASGSSFFKQGIV